MKDPEDNFIYNYMFLEGLNPKVQAEFMCLPDAVNFEDLNFQEVLVLAKCAEQAVKLQSGTLLTVPEPSPRAGGGSNQTKDESNNKKQRYSKPSMNTKSLVALT